MSVVLKVNVNDEFLKENFQVFKDEVYQSHHNEWGKDKNGFEQRAYLINTPNDRAVVLYKSEIDILSE
jgi:hypothetical protein